jgi:hypothetical protein
MEEWYDFEEPADPFVRGWLLDQWYHSKKSVDQLHAFEGSVDVLELVHLLD